MVIIGIASYPLGSAKEMGKHFRELITLAQAYMTQKGPYVISEIGEGIKSLTLFEFDQSKIAEANEYVR